MMPAGAVVSVVAGQELVPTVMDCSGRLPAVIRIIVHIAVPFVDAREPPGQATTWTGSYAHEPPLHASATHAPMHHSCSIYTVTI